MKPTKLRLAGYATEAQAIFAIKDLKFRGWDCSPAILRQDGWGFEAVREPKPADHGPDPEHDPDL
jgi:hypothetical protein